MLDIDFTPDGWLAGLPERQSATIVALISSGKSEDEIGEMWLSTQSANNTVGFGVGTPIQTFYANVKAEFVAFVCGDPRYDIERSQAVQLWNSQGKAGLVSLVSAVVASTVGLAAAAIVPIIALLFSLVAKVGVNAFCASSKTSFPPPGMT